MAAFFHFPFFSVTHVLVKLCDFSVAGLENVAAEMCCDSFVNAAQASFMEICQREMFA